MREPLPDASGNALLGRRSLLRQAGGALATLGLSQIPPAARAAVDPSPGVFVPPPHHPAKAKRLIYLFQSGGPSQIELFDPKPQLQRLAGQDLPESVRQGQRLTAMTPAQSPLLVVPSHFAHRRHGQSGAWMSELLPHLGRVADDLCIVRSVHTEAINHDPAITFCQTCTQLAGRPSLGAWLSYGLASRN